MALAETILREEPDFDQNNVLRPNRPGLTNSCAFSRKEIKDR